jgi:hypothetical protein
VGLHPFAVTTADTKHLSLKEAEELVELEADRNIQLKFKETTRLQLWNLAKKIYFSVLSEVALSTLLQFSTTYLCEQGFTGLAYIKNKKRERLPSLAQELRVCVSAIIPRVKQLCKRKEAHTSH